MTLLGAAPAAASVRPVGQAISPSQAACPIRHVVLNATYSCVDEFTVRGTGGYEITVSAAPGSRHLEVTAESPEGVVEYLAPAKVTAGAIRARVRRIGRIAVHFRPSGHERRVKVPKNCLKGRPPVVTARLGRFVGTIELRGERGYTTVDAHGAAGGVGDPLADVPRKLECEVDKTKAQARRELRSIQFEGAPVREGIFFDAFRLFPSFQPLPSWRPHPPPDRDHYGFLAAAIEGRGRVIIVRAAAAFGGPPTFSFDESLASAAISPPAPFTGTGTFLRGADGSTSWTGSLAVRLPGLGTVPLTGGKAELATVAAQRKRFDAELEGQTMRRYVASGG